MFSKNGKALAAIKSHLRREIKVRSGRSQNNQQSQSYRLKSSPQTSRSLQEQGVGSGPQLVQMTIYKFNKETQAKREVKVVKPVVESRIKPLPPQPKPINHDPTPVPIPAPPPAPVPAPVPEPIPTPVPKPAPKPDPVPEPVQMPVPESLNDDLPADHLVRIPQVEEQELPVSHDYQVYRLGDVYTGRRCIMKHLGIDIGTRTVVLAYRNDNEEVHYISEINGYWPFERATPFIKNMLDDPNKVRSDGTKRTARWIEMPDTGEAIVLGQDAEEFAYAKNDTLRRPMAEGGISADEEAMTILGSIVQGLMEMAENEVGQFTDELKVCYCTTAPALNKDINVDYHERVVNLVISGYETKAKITHQSIRESHAIVIKMSPDGTGIGISWGAGTVTVSYVKYGLEIFSFCWVGAGDWIDEQVAVRYGYSPNASKVRRKTAKETPTTVSKRKQDDDFDLTPGKEPEDRVGLDIALHYDVLISTVIDGIIKGFEENESEARLDGDAINVYMAGGTSSPKGFVKRVAKKFDELDVPFEIGTVSRSDVPLYCVATGCLEAAEKGIVD